MVDEFTEAVRKLKESFLLDHGNRGLLFLLGKQYFTQRRFEEAKFFILKALEGCTDSSFIEMLQMELVILERYIQFDSMNEIVHTPELLDLLVKELLDNSANNYRYNVDIEMLELFHMPFPNTEVVHAADEKIQIVNHLQGISNLFNSLADQASRDLLIKLLAFRMQGNKKVMLPLNTQAYWARRQFIRKLKTPAAPIKTKVHQWDLHLFDLRPLGYDIDLYCFPIGLSATFAEKQYEYSNIAPSIKAEPNDIVIDAGGCFGDTALYFAHEVGEKGHVYTFEFIPSNLEIMKTNLQINPLLQERVTIVENPVWNASGQLLYYRDHGPGSFVSFTGEEGVSDTTRTLSIDDLVKQKGLQRVDFIKMDIEGAEWNALKGAAETLKAFKPKLALTIYHQVSDFDHLAEYINELNLGYRFYLGHYTIHAQETVLFAISN